MKNKKSSVLLLFFSLIIISGIIIGLYFLTKKLINNCNDKDRDTLYCAGGFLIGMWIYVVGIGIIVLLIYVCRNRFIKKDIFIGSGSGSKPDCLLYSENARKIFKKLRKAAEKGEMTGHEVITSAKRIAKGVKNACKKEFEGKIVPEIQGELNKIIPEEYLKNKEILNVQEEKK